MEPHLTFVSFVGKPGAGKDTQADKLKKVFGEKAAILSTGGAYRKSKDPTTEEHRMYFKLFEPYIDLVDNHCGYFPDEAILTVVQDMVQRSRAKGAEIIIFTGFPRTEGQSKMADRLVESYKCSNELYFNLEISDETSARRTEGRDTSLIGGKEVEKRPEDRNIEARLATFRKDTLPMIDRLGGRIKKIDGEQDIETVFQAVIRCVRWKRGF